MTGIQDVIVTLEAERAKIDRAVEALRALQRGVAPVVTPADSGEISAQAVPEFFAHLEHVPPPPPARPVGKDLASRPARSAPAPAPTQEPPTRATSVRPGSDLDRVYQALRVIGPASAAAVGAQGKVSREVASAALKGLRKKGLVTVAGHAKTAQWSIVARKPPTSVPDVGLEVVWSGSKERNGEAPGLAGNRPTRTQ